MEELSKYVLLNISCGVAKGKYICMMESGYVSLPDRLQLQYEFMEEEQDVVAVGETLLHVGSVVLFENLFVCKTER